VGSEVLSEQAQLNFSFRNKFIILLPRGLLLDNNTFSKMCVFKSYWLIEVQLQVSNEKFYILFGGSLEY